MIQSLSREQKEKLLIALIEKQQLLDANRLNDFKSNPGFQEKFYRSTAKVLLATAGNQSGKTHVGSVRAAQVALGTHTTLKIKTPNTGVIVSAQGFKDGIEKVIVPKILQVVGSRDIIKIKKNSQGTPVKILWRNGSITHLMSAEQDDKVFEGVTIDWFWMDGTMRREIFIALKRGFLTTDGYMWMTCTPLDEAWIYEDIYIKGVEGKDPNIEVCEGTSDENRYISEAAKIEFKKHLTEDEYEARWLGKFKHLTGRVFKHYDPTRHRIPAFDIPEHWPVWCSIDPHTKKPHAVLFVAVSPKNIKYACNEIYLRCDIKTLAGHILDIGSQYNVVQTLVDTSAQEDDWSKRSAREMLQDYGVRTKLAQKKNRKKSGIIMLNQDFKDDVAFVFESCKRLHRELQNQIFTKTKSSSIVNEEPEKKWDDMTDDWRYINAERPMYRNRPKIKTLGFVPYQRSM